MIFNGTDYTIPVIVIISIVLLFTVQYILCTKTKKIIIKLIPLLYDVFIMVLGVLTLLMPSGGGFIDLRAAIALLLFIYAVICAASILAAWIVYIVKKNK